MSCVKQREKTLVGVLLGIPSQRPGGAPGRCEQRSRSECRLRGRGVRRGEQPVELAAGAVLLVFAPPWVMLISEEKASQKGVV